MTRPPDRYQYTICIIRQQHVRQVANGERLIYYRNTLGEGDTVSSSLRTALSIVFLVGLGLPEKAHSQAVYGSIVGTVQDASGAAVSGAKVTIRNVERDVANSAVTNESGNYSQRYLIVGRY